MFSRILEDCNRIKVRTDMANVPQGLKDGDESEPKKAFLSYNMSVEVGE